MGDLEKIAWQWISEKPENIDVASENYCKTRDIFQARLEKMATDLLREGKVNEDKIYIATAISGEIGNNSYDHNLGNWPDLPGTFFSYAFSNNKLIIALADRGQGVLNTLKRVKPELESDEEALQAAFTERISGRAPESRGNGLKFVRESVQEEKIRLEFYSGKAKAQLNEDFKIEETEKDIKGCLAIIIIKI